ncbi:MAG: hypothetical protein AAAB20_18480 [Rhizobium sp.]|uniref:hypothetical protein n=1 Tax=Rhizobium sp. TaxID=391 RepID=UPI0030F076B9
MKNGVLTGGSPLAVSTTGLINIIRVLGLLVKWFMFRLIMTCAFKIDAKNVP